MRSYLLLIVLFWCLCLDHTFSQSEIKILLDSGTSANRNRLQGLPDPTHDQALLSLKLDTIKVDIDYQYVEVSDMLHNLSDLGNKKGADVRFMFIESGLSESISHRQVTLHASHLSLRQVIEIAAGQAGLFWIIGEKYIYCEFETSTLQVQMYNPSAKVKKLILDSRKSTQIIDVKALIGRMGIHFSEEATAVYIPETGLIIARTSPQDFDRIGSILDSY